MSHVLFHYEQVVKLSAADVDVLDSGNSCAQYKESLFCSSSFAAPGASGQPSARNWGVCSVDIDASA